VGEKMDMKKNATIKDVALMSGFSIATVSAVINGKDIVSPKAKASIEKAIKELNYKPNRIARSLKNSKTSSIAILVRSITNPLYLQVVLGLEEITWDRNFEILFCSIGPNLEREEQYIDNLIERRVDGVVIATSTMERQDSLNKLKKNDIPYVFVNRRPKILFDNEWFIGLNNQKASSLVLNHLNDLGVTKIAYLSGPTEYSTFYERKEGFTKEVERLKLEIPKEFIFETDFTKEEGYRITDKLIRLKNRPEAIFCSSDLIASGAFMAIKHKELKIPDDIMITGIDNSDMTELIDLTTIEPQAKEMGRMAGKILIDLISKGESSFERETLVEPKLVIRSSTTKNSTL
jgi:DNA-binding LacI/PurR family transcriptional regulator